MQKTIYSEQSRLLVEELRRLRNESGLTMRQLAEKVGREHNYIGRIELGERRLDIVEAYWLFKAIGCSPEDTASRLMKIFAQADSSDS